MTGGGEGRSPDPTPSYASPSSTHCTLALAHGLRPSSLQLDEAPGTRQESLIKEGKRENKANSPALQRKESFFIELFGVNLSQTKTKEYDNGARRQEQGNTEGQRGRGGKETGVHLGRNYSPHFLPHPISSTIHYKLKKTWITRDLSNMLKEWGKKQDCSRKRWINMTIPLQNEQIRKGE